ncbi:hypothetical protein BaRGS_00002224 [Batillaria attramentaria]|uniref:Uncharacterized protein n=1 Tax=Batillaria attramentaria TaxID=370345 RepID=A0ABD0M4A0_9CAEN
MPPKKHEDLGAGESAGLGRSSERQNRLAAGKIVNGIIDLVNQGAMHSLLARCAISYALDTLLKSQDVSHDKVMGESLVRLVLKGALAQGILSQEEALETSQISDLAETALPTALQSATENGILDDNTCLVGVLGLALQGALKEGNIPDRLAGYFKKAAQESTEDGYPQVGLRAKPRTPVPARPDIPPRHSISVGDQARTPIPVARYTMQADERERQVASPDPLIGELASMPGRSTLPGEQIRQASVYGGDQSQGGLRAVRPREISRQTPNRPQYGEQALWRSMQPLEQLRMSASRSRYGEQSSTSPLPADEEDITDLLF